ncbi:MAG: CmcJ/NvfI family oxidoreductase [Sphingomicrobium sp.]
MVQVRLKGLLPPGMDPATMPTINVLEPPGPRQEPDYAAFDIRDGRPAPDDLRSEAERFAEDGFVLLPHDTRVRDWDDDVASIYLPEIEAILRDRLFPGRRIEIAQRAPLIRRGRNTKENYAQGVHSDGPLTPDHFAQNVGGFAGPDAVRWWKGGFDRAEVSGYVNVDFWRTTNMSGPLEHMPLALCRPASLDRADIVPTSMVGIAPERRETRHLTLRYNPSQSWVYFPGMEADELLAFKLCEFWKDDPDGQPQNVFHTAFEHPDTPADAEHRQSCEHRVGVFVLRD